MRRECSKSDRRRVLSKRDDKSKDERIAEIDSQIKSMRICLKCEIEALIDEKSAIGRSRGRLRCDHEGPSSPVTGGQVPALATYMCLS